MSTAIITRLYAKDLSRAYEGSYYTIAGAGGDLSEWTEGIEGVLAEQGIGKPAAWYLTTGESVNSYAGDIPHPERDYFPHDITILLFPLDGLDMGKLALFKVRMGDRWFDDVIDNMHH